MPTLRLNMNIKFYKDRYKNPRVDLPKSLEALAWYLEQDLQKSMSCCDDMIKITESVEQGQLDSWKGTGNAHTVTINPKSVIIFNEFSDEVDSCSMATNEFKNAVLSWRNFIQEP
jgi:uncharacterized protein YacL (UPF0231 family)